MTGTAARDAGLFLTHSDKDRILTHYERLKRETEGQVDWSLLFDPGAFAKGGSPESVIFSNQVPARFSQAKAEPKFSGGFLDVPIIAAALQSSHPFVWVIEYDVDWTGNWRDFFSQFTCNSADLLTTTLASREDSPNWWHWGDAAAPSYVDRRNWLRDFHPIMRLSRAFILAYAAEIGREGWSGYSEFTMPTVANHLGLTVEDIGGFGALCPPSRIGKNYRNTPQDWRLSPGTFVWRPSAKNYHHEAPGAFVEMGMLYHPIKADVGEWEFAEMRNRHNLHEMKQHLKHGRILQAARCSSKIGLSFAFSRLRAKILG